MGRFMVIEARRLLPLMFLLVLLVSLSIFDNFFRLEPVTGPEHGVENVISFVTADRGIVEASASFKIIHSMEQWQDLQRELAGLPDYPFNAAYEVAVKTVNSEIKSINLYPQADDDSQVQIRVVPKQGAYHVVTVERDRLGEQTRWLFIDEEDRVLEEVVIPDIMVHSPVDDE